MPSVIKKKEKEEREEEREGSLTSDFKLPAILASVPMGILNIKKSRNR